MSVWRKTGVRWMKFNLVGAIGIAVQLGILGALTAGLHVSYLLATALAVEAAVLHNFVWHEHYTWSDRRSAGIARVLKRLLRFNATTGAISIGGNLLLMPLLVGAAHLPALVANILSIAACSIANFLVSDRVVFKRRVSDPARVMSAGFAFAHVVRRINSCHPEAERTLRSEGPAVLHFEGVIVSEGGTPAFSPAEETRVERSRFCWHVSTCRKSPRPHLTGTATRSPTWFIS